MLVSIDVGRRNMSYCVLDNTPEGIKIVHWEVFELLNATHDTICKILFEALEERKEKWADSDTVLIERQMKKSMMLLAAYMEMYFNSIGKRTIMYSACYKLAGVLGNAQGRDKYAARKKASVVETTKFLKEHPQRPELMEMFRNTKKLDDLCDAFLQGRSYIISPPKRYIEKKPKEVKCRKPTAKQEKSQKYSKHNLKYLIKEMIDAGRENTVISIDPNKSALEYIVDNDKRLKKGIARFYKSTLECLVDLKFINLPSPPPPPTQ